MKHFRNFCTNSDFLKNQRWIWQKRVAHQISELKAEEEETREIPEGGDEEEMTLGEVLKLWDEAKKGEEIVRQISKAAQKKGHEWVRQTFASIQEIKDVQDRAREYAKMTKIPQFVDKLWDTYLSVFEIGLDDSPFTKKAIRLRDGKEKEVDVPIENRDLEGQHEHKLHILSKHMNLKEVMERFKEAKSYKIESEPSWRIIFTNPDGKKEEKALEWTSKDEHLRGIQKDARARQEERERQRQMEAEREEAERKKYEREEHGARLVERMRKVKAMPTEGLTEEDEQERREKVEKWREKMQKRILKTSFLNTPGQALAKLDKIASALSDELRNRLSEPLSGAAQLWSTIEVDYDSEDFNLKNIG